MFHLSTTSLEQLNLRGGLTSDQAGAFCSFEGRVREHHDGRKVTALEYEAHASLCESEAAKIFEETKAKFSILAAKAFHRVGRLNVGDIAVWVGVIAAHRDEAFQACRYVIDEIKSRLPIWKKEYYENGDCGWLRCQEISPDRRPQ